MVEAETGLCTACRSEIPVAATRCPACCYDPSQYRKLSTVLVGLAGVLLTLTVVGAPLGIPLVVLALYRRRRAKKRRPTAYER